MDAHDLMADRLMAAGVDIRRKFVASPGHVAKYFPTGRD